MQRLAAQGARPVACNEVLQLVPQGGAAPSGWTKPRWTPPRALHRRPARSARARRRAPGRDADGARRTPARTGRARPSRWCRRWCSASSSASWSAGTRRWQRAGAAPDVPRRGAAGARAERGRRLRHPHRRGRGTGPPGARTWTRSTRLLKAGGELGKRLDFLIQELQREANTLGSQVGGAGADQHLGGDEGGHRADARAGAEHRVSHGSSRARRLD